MKNCFNFILSSIIVLFFLMLPEIIYGFVNPQFKICFIGEKLAVIYILAIILTAMPFSKFKAVFLFCFSIFSIIQFCYMQYFGNYLTAYAINFIFLEAHDIWLESKSIWLNYIPLILLVAVPYFVLFLLWKKNILPQFVFPYYPICFFLFFGYFIYQATTPNGIFQMLFKNTCYASYNTINSFSAFFGNVLPQQFFKTENKKNFDKYQITHIEKDLKTPRNIIFIVGESTNADNMSLFGYNIKTTPKLEAYAAADKNFVSTKVWAAAVNTLISLPMLYNIQYHPEDYKKLIIKDTNLLRLAKLGNYHVSYIELQNAGVFRKTNLDNYDQLFIYDKNKDKEFSGEDAFLDFVLPKINLKERNFIIIHQRNIHSPYTDNYQNNADISTTALKTTNSKRIDDYNKAMFYEDMILDKLLKYASSLPNETYFYYVSDHGESLGQNGLWGHGHLDTSDLKVPFLFSMFNSNDGDYRAKISSGISCAYEVSILIAEKLGYKIEITDKEDGVCLVNGRDSMGRAGILKIKGKPDSGESAQKLPPR